MSEAKPQDGSTVTGYRTLTATDTQRMNQLKAISREFCNAITELHAEGANPRWLAIAKTDMQRACMMACRAVAKPDDDC